jgi:flagellar motor switch/type III secretory pathway protein FliN
MKIYEIVSLVVLIGGTIFGIVKFIVFASSKVTKFATLEDTVKYQSIKIEELEKKIEEEKDARANQIDEAFNEFREDFSKIIENQNKLFDSNNDIKIVINLILQRLEMDIKKYKQL